jgi:hypothetical protein
VAECQQIRTNSRSTVLQLERYPRFSRFCRQLCSSCSFSVQ